MFSTIGSSVSTVLFIVMTVFILYCMFHSIVDYVKNGNFKKPSIHLKVNLPSDKDFLYRNARLIKSKIPTKEKLKSYLNRIKEVRRKEKESINREFVKPRTNNDECRKRARDLEKIERYYDNTLDRQEIDIIQKCHKSRSSH